MITTAKHVPPSLQLCVYNPPFLLFEKTVDKNKVWKNITIFGIQFIIYFLCNQ